MGGTCYPSPGIGISAIQQGALTGRPAVRAAVLTNKPATGRIVASNTAPIKTIPRADLAAFLVAELVNQDHVNRVISVTSGQ